MPSVKLELGKYVTLRRRQDGTYRVLMEVPARLRPSDWLPAIPLPIEGSRTGDLTDLDELARIKSDAARLYTNLLRLRAGYEPAERTTKDLPRLVREWEKSQFFKAKKPRTQKGYSYHAGLVLDWSEATGHKPVAALSRKAIEDFLALYDDRPTTRRHVKIVLKMLLDHAIAMEWRADNPAERIKVTAPETEVTIWELEDVRREAWACAEAGQPSIAALILTNWEIGQRLTDVRLFRRGAEYINGAFRFWQSKTGAYVTIEVSAELQELLAAIEKPDSLYLFTDAATGKPWDEQRLGHVFAAIRTKPELQLRALRHSCVVQLARHDATIPEIASITGHSPFSAEQILRKYLPRDNELAWAAQRKRGLIGTTRAQESDGGSDRKSDGADAARSPNPKTATRAKG
jgi:hypothetical protein